MRLHEIADNDFEDPEETPVQAYDRVVNRAKALEQYARHLLLNQNQYVIKLDPGEPPSAGERFVGIDDAGIQKRKAEGFYPLLDYTNGRTIVKLYYKITPQNQTIINQLRKLNRMVVHAYEEAYNNQKLINPYKAKFQAWVRKQPDYVKRDDAKEVAKIVGDKLVAWSKEKFSIVPTLREANFWKKANMIVVTLGYEQQHTKGNVTLWQDLKNKIMPALKQHLADEKYSARIKTDYFGPHATDLKIFIPADEAVNKNKG